MFILLAVALCTSAQQIGVQQGVLIEHPQGIATPFREPSGLQPNLPELEQKNVDFLRFISKPNVGIFNPPSSNESTVRRFTLDNILYQRDDTIEYRPNTPKITSAPTMKPAAEYSFRQPQNSAALQRQNQSPLAQTQLSGYSKIVRDTGAATSTPQQVIRNAERPGAVYQRERESGYHYRVPSRTVYI